jgi:hypothetical protein
VRTITFNDERFVWILVLTHKKTLAKRELFGHNFAIGIKLH